MDVEGGEDTLTQQYAKAGNHTVTGKAYSGKSDGKRDPTPPFLRLPDDLLIEICSYLAINEYFSLRQTSTHICAFLTKYSSSIGHHIARNTPFTPSWALPPVDTNPWTVHRIRSLIPLTMATVLVSQFRHISTGLYPRSNTPSSSRYGFAPNDPRGREAVMAIAKGIQVWKELSNISKRFERASNGFKNQLSLVSYGLFEYWNPRGAQSLTAYRTRNTEAAVLKARMRLLRKPYAKTGHSTYKAMANRDKEEMARVCSMALSLTQLCITASWSEDRKPFHPIHWCDHDRTFFGSNPLSGSWINWALLHEGPRMFWAQWSGMRSGGVRLQLLEMYYWRAEGRAQVEREYAVKLMKGMHEIAVWGYDERHSNGDWGVLVAPPALLEVRGERPDGEERYSGGSDVGMLFWVFLCCDHRKEQRPTVAKVVE